jgi:hypothetical protein
MQYESNYMTHLARLNFSVKIFESPEFRENVRPVFNEPTISSEKSEIEKLALQRNSQKTVIIWPIKSERPIHSCLKICLQLSKNRI